MTAPGRDIGAEYRDLRPAARMLATNHPHIFYWMGGVEALFFAVLGAIFMPRSVVGGVLMIAIGLACAAFTALPAHWSERHQDEAAHAVKVQRDYRNDRARKHPAYFLVLLPIVTALSAATRWNRPHQHHSVLTWVVPAVIGLAFGVILGGILVLRARRSRASTLPG